MWKISFHFKSRSLKYRIGVAEHIVIEIKLRYIKFMGFWFLHLRSTTYTPMYRNEQVYVITPTRLSASRGYDQCCRPTRYVCAILFTSSGSQGLRRFTQPTRHVTRLAYHDRQIRYVSSLFPFCVPCWALWFNHLPSWWNCNLEVVVGRWGTVKRPILLF